MDLIGPVEEAPPVEPARVGAALRRWRASRRMKQSHAAERFGVTQSTISRWEAGAPGMAPHDRRSLSAALSARLETAADQALGRLVQESPRPVHLICDLTHRLLACSPTRAAEFSRPLHDMLGRSLLPYATPAILAFERELAGAGWGEVLTPDAIEFDTGANESPIVPIVSSRCRWTRLTLSDGTSARLVETI